MPIHIQNVLNGGEIGPMCRARADQPRYRSGCQTLQNFLPMPQGGVTRRPGLVYLGEAKSASSRLIPFVFSETQGRILEFGEKTMRIWMPNGTQVATSDGGIFSVATPYAAADLADLRFAQSADVIYFAHRKYPPHKLSRYADNDWRWTQLTFAPSIGAPVNPSAAIVGTGLGNNASTRTYKYVVTAVDDDTGQESAASSAAIATGESLTSAYGVRISWTAPAGAVAEYRIYKLKGGIYGFIGRAKGTTSFEDYNIIPDDGDTPPTYNTPFSGEGNYPGLVFFHQGRLGWASTDNQPMTVWLSRSNELESLAESVVPKSDDSIEVTLAATQANAFTWLLPDRTALCVGTTGNEWTLEPSGSAILTPGNPAFNKQTSNGGESLHPLYVGGSVIYLQRGSSAVRAFAYSYNEDKYVGQDITILSRHILQDVTIKAWAYQQEPYSIIWAVMSDGTIATCTAMFDQQVIGWARHKTNGRVLDVVTIPGTTDDQMWFLVERRVGGVWHTFVEKLAPFFDSDDLGDAVFLDSSLSYSGDPIDHVTGLMHLAGETVSVFADGGTVENVTVGTDGSFDLHKAAGSITVGLPFTSLMVPSRPELDLQTGSTMMHNRKVSELRLRVYRSMSFEIGIDEGRTFPVVDRNVVSGKFKTSPFWMEGVSDLSFVLAGAWSADSVPRFEVSTPTPLTILAILTTMDVSPNVGR